MNLSFLLNLGLEYICGSINALVESDKVYIWRAQILFIGSNSRIKRLKYCKWLQQTCCFPIKNSIRDGQILEPWENQ